LCSSGLPSDVTIEVEDVSFHLHKFPLLSRSKTLENLIEDSSDDEKKMKYEDEKQPSVLKLNDIPGGPKTFLLIAKFCYGVKLEVNSSNIVPLRCAADTPKQVKNVELQKSCIRFSRCIDALALKACTFDKDLFGWPVSTTKDNPFATVIWNGIQTTSTNQDWWHEDVSKLSLPLYRRFILAVESRNPPDHECIAGSLVFYAKKHLPLLGRESTFSNGNLYTSAFDSNSDQKIFLEEIVDLLPSQKNVVPTKLLSAAMNHHDFKM
ncbi:BTB/POZ domain-containing protein-like protein, partial [Tanacetum coccineum]